MPDPKIPLNQIYSIPQAMYLPTPNSASQLCADPRVVALLPAAREHRFRLELVGAMRQWRSGAQIFQRYGVFLCQPPTWRPPWSYRLNT